MPLYPDLTLTLDLTQQILVTGRMDRNRRTTTLEDLPDNVCLLIAQHLALTCPLDMRSFVTSKQ